MQTDAVSFIYQDASELAAYGLHIARYGHCH